MKSDLGHWCDGADINHDNDLRLQYLGGWGINSDLADPIYRQMLVFRRAPVGLFGGSPDKVQAVMASFGR